MGPTKNEETNPFQDGLSDNASSAYAKMALFQNRAKTAQNSRKPGMIDRLESLLRRYYQPHRVGEKAKKIATAGANKLAVTEKHDRLFAMNRHRASGECSDIG